ncbi:hypothetical protein BpHYR1_051264 [Brachionus plicatilis]|uniref:Uncharacterized protein n=1 Tax=Brachionus plicatilis TaxID=10195 RepID=A0A3M7SRD2_BRAPC|nr:hypothetical protein BpHYR1_051264 [Brachionus plicatilis]
MSRNGYSREYSQLFKSHSPSRRKFKKKDPFHSNMKKPILLLAFLVIFSCMNTSQARSKSKKSRKSSNQTSLLSEQNLRQELTTIFEKNELNKVMMFRMISDVNAYVIFDCEKPSYIAPGNQLVTLKNHIINYDLERRKDPRITNESSAYMCDKNENIWRVNPEIFKSKGFIGFDHDKAAEADGNFIVLADEKAIKDYVQNIDADDKLAKKIVQLAYTITHHPKFYRVDKSKNSKLVDVYAEQEKKIPPWLRDQRSKQINRLYKQLTKEGKNFTVPKHPKLKEDTFADGFSFIIFDCKDPSILHPTKDKKALLKKLNDTLFSLVLKKTGHCTDDKIWRNSANENFLTFDAKGLGLGFSPSLKLLTIMKMKGMCDDYMKFMYHPAYYLKGFLKPEQCTSDVGEKEEEKKINDILDEHFGKKSTRPAKPLKRSKTRGQKKKSKKQKLIDKNSKQTQESDGFED